MLLGDRQEIRDRLPMPTHNTETATKLTDVTAEAISFTDGAVGTTQKIKLVYNNVLAEQGERIGKRGDTSLSFGTGTVLTTEKEWRFKNAGGYDTDTQRLATMSNGDYMIDYENGYILGKNATITSTSTDAATYKVKLQDVADVTIEAGDVQIGAVELKDATGANRANIDSNGYLYVRPASTYLEDTAHTDADRGTFILSVRQDTATALGGEGDYLPLITDNAGRLHIVDENTAEIRSDIGVIRDTIFREDDAHTSLDKGIQILTVRNDALAALAGTDGDYAPFQVNAIGALYTVGSAGTAYMGKVRRTDGVTDETLPTTAAVASGASGANLLAAGSGSTKHKIFYMILSVDTAGTVTLSDGMGVHYMAANSHVMVDFRPLGLEQTTADTAITVTNGGGGNFSASLTYLTG